MNREQLMRQIQETGFAMFDLNLFLDSHPQNRMALDYFNEVRARNAELRAQYESMFGPLTMGGTNTDQGWTWVRDPWPWELEV